MGKARKSKNLNVPKHIASGPGERITQTVLKRRKKIEQVHADKVRHGQEHQKHAGERKKLRMQVFKNARDFVNNFKRRENQKKTIARRQKHQIRESPKVPKDSEGSTTFVIRVKGDDIPVTCKRMLQMWRLEKMYEGVFVTLNKETLAALNILRDYVKWGYPTPDQIRTLIRTRGYTTNASGMRLPISGNQMVEEHLGSCGILCLEDIEHVVQNHTPEFEKVASFLAPFRLEPPDKDDSEAARRTRERKTDAGEHSFASYLLSTMPINPKAAAPKKQVTRDAL
eukprot:TRINITY_DN17775_c0_g3_i1.p1 TRINITY_DN17775_c0_g3~~TRINITY_DN17775_c0_g3_i1.p1  ORF type:complete len:283 (+),score=57.21 TRINITY_DN17775_c0_g3_i1:47-895(+)